MRIQPVSYTSALSYPSFIFFPPPGLLLDEPGKSVLGDTDDLAVVEGMPGKVVEVREKGLLLYIGAAAALYQVSSFKGSLVVVSQPTRSCLRMGFLTSQYVTSYSLRMHREKAACHANGLCFRASAGASSSRKVDSFVSAERGRSKMYTTCLPVW